jgi:uncharacterized protein DUF4157
MFAPKVTKPQPEAAKGPTSKLEQQRSTLAARPFGGGAVEQAHVLQRRLPLKVVDDVLGTPGQALEPAARTYFEPFFGYDLSKVSIHIDPYAAASAPAPDRLRPSQVPAILPDALLRAAPWSRLFGTDLSAVRLHPESSRAGGRVHALTEGDHVYFAPGRFAPGTEQGDRLIAHELAHVTQQRRPGPPSPSLAAELDADAVAEAVVRGEAARTRASLVAGRAHAYEAWEHRQLGDALGGEDRRIRLPNGVEVTYGQIIALSGDFYRSPEALLRAPRVELEAILREMAHERALATASPTHAPSAADANAINAAYELATTGNNDRIGSSVPPLAGDTNVVSGPHGEVREGEHVESNAPGAGASFLDLAAANPAHFSPENIFLNWIPKHQLALDLARQAWQGRHPGATPAAIVSASHASARAGTAAAGTAPAAGLPATAAAAASIATGRADPAATSTPAGLASAASTASTAEQNEAQAWLSSAFADHFLTDAFASGHLISGSAGRTICQTFFNTHAAAITAACWACAVVDGAKPDEAALIVSAIRAFITSRASSLLLKTVHDYYNRTGLEVRNALGQVWRTVGDAHLGSSPETIAMGGVASKASRDAVQDVLSTGGTTRAEAALDYIPDMVRVGGGTFEPIATFSTNPLVWYPILARSLSRSPAINDLYQLIKGNIGPMASLKGQQAKRSVQSAAGAARRRVGEQVEDVKRAPARLEEAIERLYGVPR